MKNRARLLVFALLGLSCVSAVALDWPHYRGPDYNGISQETGWLTKWPADGPKRLWKAEVGIGFASFAVSEGKVYTAGNAKDTDTVYCFDALTGKELWKHSYPAKLDPKYYEGGPSATPTVEGGRVYMFSKRGMAHCLDATKGSVIWAKDLAEELKAKMPTWGFASSVVIDGDLAIFNVGSTGAALDKKTGKVVWSSGPDEAGYSSVVPFLSGGKRAVTFATKDQVVAVSVADGKLIWEFPWKTQYDVNPTDPILFGNKVFISSGYNHGAGVFDVSSQPAKQLWQNKEMRNHINCSVLWQGHIYGMDEGQLRCLVFDTGEVKWTAKQTGKGSLTLADGKLIVLSEKGELMLADASPAGFNVIARAQVLGGKCWTTPVLANGKIYCRNAAGNVVCVEVSKN